MGNSDFIFYLSFFIFTPKFPDTHETSRGFDGFDNPSSVHIYEILERNQRGHDHRQGVGLLTRSCVFTEESRGSMSW